MPVAIRVMITARIFCGAIHAPRAVSRRRGTHKVNAGGEGIMKELFGLEGKRVIVLGGGLGMGEATSNLLADLGAHVAVLDIIPERAERVAADISKKGV